VATVAAAFSVVLLHPGDLPATARAALLLAPPTAETPP